MASLNPFDLLDDDAEDPSLLIAAQQQKIEAMKTTAPAAKPAAGGKDLPSQNKVTAQPRLPSKPTPPAQAVRESKSEYARGGQSGGGRGYGRGRGYGGGGGGSYRDSPNNENSYDNMKISANPDEADSGKTSERRGGGYIVGGSRSSFRGGRRGGFSNGDAGEGEGDRPRRPLDRRSGTGRGNEFKREGAGRGNWGTHTDELAEVTEEAVIEGEKAPSVEKPSGEVDAAADGDKEAAAATEVEEKEPEDKEMTLEEYEKVLEEKRKSLLALKADSEARKVDVKEFESMQQLSSKKKSNDDIFIKLGSEKDKKKELAEKEERAKKSVSINEFLKPAEGERHYSSGGRGRGRGRGSRGGGGGYGGGRNENVRAPAIEDPGQFPTLGGKK